VPTISKTFRLPEKTVDQITDLVRYFRSVVKKAGGLDYEPDQTEIVVGAVEAFHRTLCSAQADPASAERVVRGAKKRIAREIES
jgi:hypothetical protein